MGSVLTIARLTWLEARRRRVLLAAVVCGLAFLLVFAVAAHFIFARAAATEPLGVVQQRIALQMLTLAGLFVANFLTIAAAILLPVDTLSGEIASGVMQTLASKPIRRMDIVLGKWLAYALLIAGYLLLMAGGIVLIMWLVMDFLQPRVIVAIPVMLIGALSMMTVTVAGGVRLSTVSNGIVAFAFYGIAFIGGWIEQIGSMQGSDTARRVGTLISLVSPSDAMWRRAAYDLQPPVMRELMYMSPFGAPSLPSNSMLVWTVGYIVVLLGFAMHQFRRRPL